MGTQDAKPTTTHASAQDMLRALKTERAGYEGRGLTERVAAVDEQIKYWTKAAKDAPVNPDDAGEVRASDEAINAEKMLVALREEKAGLEDRDGKEKRVAAIDEQIKHWTGVLRKAKQAGGPDGATPAAAAGQQQR